jgi:hypothetical protein
MTRPILIASASAASAILIVGFLVYATWEPNAPDYQQMATVDTTAKLLPHPPARDKWR